MSKTLTNHNKFCLSLAVIALSLEWLFPQATALADSVSNLTSPVPAIQQFPQNTNRLPRYTTKVLVTAYSSTPDQTDDTPFITASGTHVKTGIVAANWLKFGTKVRLPDHFGDQIFEVQDRMHERFSNRLDIWMPSREEAKEWGIRYITVEVY